MTDHTQTVVLISAPHRFPGSVRTSCQCCKRTLYEQSTNLETVRRAQGHVICIPCAQMLEKQAGKRAPILAQLWEGELREPQDILPEYQQFVKEHAK